MTPPETYSAPDDGGWRVRVVPNLYPAFERQEVVVHSPRHVRSLAELDAQEVEAVALAWRNRAAAARSEDFGYVQAVVNEGREAGASLPHSHSQLVWLRLPPPAVAAERGLALDGALVLERDGLLVTCPYASRVPYEILIAPAEPESNAFASTRLAAALHLLVDAVRRIRAEAGVVPLNAWLHDTDHWHIELFPRTTVLAGVELGAGIYVNPLPPDEAAEALRRVSPPPPP
jgi:UDPglucose--hexose-1-phosphate uridylyltransferase